jgi:transcriptional regulator with XRE-family HTH domain
MAQAHSATVRARRLGRELHELRDEVGLSFADVATRLNCHHTKIRRIEKADVKAETEDIEALLDIYGVPTDRRLALVNLAENAWRRGWWLNFNDVLTGDYVSLEDESALIRSWQTLLIPGLLQTDDYARALISTAVPKPGPEEIEQRVEARQKRRKLLDRKNAPHLHAILGEAALRQEVGGPDVLRDQLNHLLKVAGQDNVEIQVAPFAAGAHPGLEGPFVVLGFEHEKDPDVAYAEHLGGNFYGESEEALARFRLAWGDVSGAALPPNASADFIAALAE